MSPKEQDGTQSRRTETGGSPHPANNRPDEWVVKRALFPCSHRLCALRVSRL